MKEYKLVKKIKKVLAAAHDVDVGEITIDDVDTTIFNGCLDVKYTYMSPVSFEYVNGKKTIDLVLLYE